MIAGRKLHILNPQNVLLDDNFNAKLSDFGLSKQIDKENSHVITSVRGNLGYLAPEWLGSKITEKVDFYSFGIAVQEIVCGRKVLDYSVPDDETHLPSLLKRRERKVVWCAWPMTKVGKWSYILRGIEDG